MSGFLQGLYFALGALSLAGFTLGPGLAHVEVVRPQTGFLLFALGGLLGALVTVIGIGVIVLKGPRWLLISTAMGLVPALAIVYFMIQGSKYPLINDVTTDTTSPPEFEHAATLPPNTDRNLSFPPENKGYVDIQYPEVRPLKLSVDIDEAYEKVKALAAEHENWTITSTRVSGDERYVEGVAESNTFRFKDDFVVRISPRPEGSVVDMRSKSRDGQGDFGVNANRIKKFLSELEESLGGGDDALLHSLARM